MSEENLNIGEILKLFKKKYKLIVALMVGFATIAGIWSFFVITPKYQAKVKLFIGKEESKNVGYDNSEIQMYQKLMTTYGEIIKTEDLVKEAINKNNIDLGKKEVTEVLKNLVVTPRNDTQILELTYQDDVPQRTVDVLDAITQKFILKSKELIPNGSVEIIQEAKVPQTPISPNKMKNIAKGFIGGVVLSIIIIFTMDMMDNTFKRKEDLEGILELPVIGAIPEYDLEEMKSHYHEGGRQQRKKIKSKLA